MNVSVIIKLAASFGIPALLLMLPDSAIPLENLSVVEHRIIAIFVMAALLWVLEPVPVFATSILIITLLVVSVSTHGLSMLTTADNYQNLGQLLPYSAIFNSFSSPIIILFMGGFALAIAASKYELDSNLARVLLKPFGNKIPMIMLGIMLITAVFSMFMSNTATTVMMLAIVGPIIAAAPKDDIGLKGLVLSIPVAANTGGIGTPIGTPPNAIALQYIPEGQITFAEWMSFGIPFVVVQLAIAWVVLNYMYKSKTGTINLSMEGSFQHSPRAYVVYATFASTILLWLTTSIHGMNTYVVSIVPLAVFTLTGVITKADLKLINWDVLWLVAGGIAMGMALEKSGLAVKIAHSIDFTSLSTMLVIVALSLICITMANFMSNTATANLIMPIAAAVATSLDGLSGDGGITTLLVIVALSASLGMMLPVSTPPNALAYSTGMIQTKDLLKVGGIIGATGLILLYVAMMIIL
ncbi:SLC13/DASS family transporter [Alginatibacterium sediminis]|uniref:SLC13/DASS family transporter n=1 Tax=Alginatibacterium sediminis TaxID=2164068 RepID=A0A420E7X9_9ALTE|nr:SLC13 family permease [Alginatibacterium sediminis]RKF14515.1 SLC13/DASS family transporter [Alginatibacterium sediminis]